MMLIRRELLGAAGASQNDPYFENVTLLLHGDGTNGGQNNTFVDSSTNNFTITRNGNTAQGSYSPYGNLWSNNFDGAGDYLSVSLNPTISGDFTLEGWFFCRTYRTVQNQYYNYVFCSSNSFSIPYINVAIIYNGTLNIGIKNNVGSINFATTSAVSMNTWYHFALTRQGSNVKVFLNGTQVGATQTLSGTIGITGGTYIGTSGWYPTSEMWDGYISNIRFVNGTAVYTSNFTPPSAPLTAITNTSLLTCQSNRFIDNSSNNFTITRNGDVSVQRFSPFSPTDAYSAATIGGSGYFDGTGDTLTAASNNAFSFGTGDFTVEAWIYPTQTGRGIWSNGPTSAGSFGIEITAGNVLRCDYYGGTGLAGATTIRTNTWNHIAVTRSGSTLSLYLNGSRDATTTTSSNNTSSDMVVGRTWTNYSSADWSGFISNLRVIKGQALYTGTTYTVPNAPLTTTGYGSTSQSITGTVSLLLNFTNASIFDNAMMADLETVGNAQIDTAVKKFGTGSLEFDGAGDGLLCLTSPQFVYGSGDFTIECWLYLNTTGTFGIFGHGDGSSTNLYFYINTSTPTVFFNNTGIATGPSISTGSWTHLAVTRSGTTLRVFTNGVSGTSVTNSTTLTAGGPITVGMSSSQGQVLNGYIDDLRITKGVARYTTNFTPPTAAFPNK